MYTTRVYHTTFTTAKLKPTCIYTPNIIKSAASRICVIVKYGKQSWVCIDYLLIIIEKLFDWGKIENTAITFSLINFPKIRYRSTL